MNEEKVNIDIYEYNVETDYKSLGRRTMLQWTTELPTKEGWYWYWWKHPKNDSPGIKYINKDLCFHDTLPWDDEGTWRPVEEFLNPYGVLWLGPLPVPAPPDL